MAKLFSETVATVIAPAIILVRRLHIGLPLALLAATPSTAPAQGSATKVVTLVACIDGADDLHIKGGKMWWRHLAFAPPGQHENCAGILSVNGHQWANWREPVVLPMQTDGSKISFEPVTCRGNCRLMQSPNAANGWESIYRLDDFRLLGSAVYVLQISIGGPRGAVQPPDVQNAPPFQVTAPQSQEHWL